MLGFVECKDIRDRNRLLHQPTDAIERFAFYCRLISLPPPRRLCYTPPAFIYLQAADRSLRSLSAWCLAYACGLDFRPIGPSQLDLFYM